MSFKITQPIFILKLPSYVVQQSFKAIRSQVLDESHDHDLLLIFVDEILDLAVGAYGFGPREWYTSTYTSQYYAGNLRPTHP